MPEKENARPLVAQETGRAETAACGRAAISVSNFTIPSGTRQPLRVADFLSVGEAGAVPMRHLKTVLQMDSRTIRLKIEQERRDGAAILSNNVTGYYLASNKSEKDRFVRSMMHRAAQIVTTAKAVEQTEVRNG